MKNDAPSSLCSRCYCVRAMRPTDLGQLPGSDPETPCNDERDGVEEGEGDEMEVDSSVQDTAPEVSEDASILEDSKDNIQRDESQGNAMDVDGTSVAKGAGPSVNGPRLSDPLIHYTINDLRRPIKDKTCQIKSDSKLQDPQGHARKQDVPFFKISWI